MATSKTPFVELFAWSTQDRSDRANKGRTDYTKFFRRPLALVLKALFKIWLLFKIVILNKYVRCGAIILRTIWPSVLVLILGYLFLNLMDQSQDLLDTLTQDFWYSFWAFAFLLLFGLAAWFFTRILFLLKDQVFFVEVKGEEFETLKGASHSKKVNPEPSKEQLEVDHVLKYKESGKWVTRNLDRFMLIDAATLRLFIKWTPLMLGFTPFASLLLALSKVQGTGMHVVVLVAMSFVYLAIAYGVKNYVDGRADDHANIWRHEYGELRRVHRFIISLSFVAIFVLIFLAANWYTNLGISRSIGPVAILFVALTMWMFVASVFTYLDYHFQAPFTIICLIITLLLNNNNHQIRTIEPDSAVMPGSYSSKATSAQPVDKYFSEWLNHRLASGEIARPDSLPYPVYLLATEGGGIRSAYWTAAVLDTLEQARPGFFRHVFAISGVSGGSVGAAVYTARYRDQLRRTGFSMNLHGYFAKDFLSPLLTAFLIPDLLQKFSPVAINGFDRAQYLEDSWAEAYLEMQPTESDFTPYKTFDQPFLSLWDEKLLNENCPAGTRCRSRYDIPVLLLNSTQVETGQKGILTPLRIEGNEDFKNVIDIQEKIYRHIPLKTAASISARFPVVTPPATIRVINSPSKDAANFVDGGYFDNSGTTTLLSVLSSITKGIEIDSVLRRRMKKANVEFRVLFLKNSPQTSSNDGPAASINGMYELKGPLQAFFKSWDNSWDSKEFVMREYLRGFSNDECKNDNHFPIDEQLYTFVLDRKTGIMPLGWDLSKGAEARIREQVDNLLHIRQDNAMNARLSTLFVGLRSSSAQGPNPSAASGPVPRPALAEK